MQFWGKFRQTKDLHQVTEMRTSNQQLEVGELP